MQEESKFTLDFMDEQLSQLSHNAFEIDDESKIILGIIAKNGPVNETEITKLGRRRVSLSREIIRRRLLITDLTDNYVEVSKGKKIRNLKKTEKIYSLSFKGLLASLKNTSLQDNFWIKNYIKFIESITEKRTAEIFLQHIYIHIISFLILYSNKYGMLTKYQNIEESFYGNYSGFDNEGFLSPTLVRGIPTQLRELFIFSYRQFYVSSEIIGYLVKKFMTYFNSLKMKNEEKDLKFEEILDKIFRRWMWQIFSIVNNKSNNILESIIDYDDYEEETIDVSIDMHIEFGDEMWDTFSFYAVDEINKLIPKENINPADYVNHKSEIDSLISF